MTTRVEERPLLCFGENQTHGALLCAPSYTPLALLILVPGSGPTTRDGIPVSEQIEGTHPPFAVWSNHLVAQRYAVVRYDKHRASTMSESLCFSPPAGIAQEYDLDLDSVIAAIQDGDTANRSPIILVGHSLGAIGALHYARKNRRIKAVAAISAPPFGLIALLKHQLRGLLPEANYQALSVDLDRVQEPGSTHTALGAPASYWQDYEKHTLEHLLFTRHRQLPALLLYGEKDALIPNELVIALHQRLRDRSQISFEVVPGADHFLMVRPPTQKGDDGDYELSRLVEWLRKISPPTG